MSECCGFHFRLYLVWTSAPSENRKRILQGNDHLLSYLTTTLHRTTPLNRSPNNTAIMPEGEIIQSKKSFMGMPVRPSPFYRTDLAESLALSFEHVSFEKACSFL